MKVEHVSKVWDWNIAVMQSICASWNTTWFTSNQEIRNTWKNLRTTREPVKHTMVNASILKASISTTLNWMVFSCIASQYYNRYDTTRLQVNQRQVRDRFQNFGMGYILLQRQIFAGYATAIWVTTMEGSRILRSIS